MWLYSGFGEGRGCAGRRVTRYAWLTRPVAARTVAVLASVDRSRARVVARCVADAYRMSPLDFLTQSGRAQIKGSGRPRAAICEYQRSVGRCSA